MFCQKCSYILTGSESYCPSCGTPCNKKIDSENEVEATTAFFGNEKENTEITTGIFDDDIPQQEDENEPLKKSKSSVAFVSVLLFVAVVAALIVVADYFNISPAISTLFEKVYSEEETSSALTTASDFDNSAGTLSPKIVFNTAVAYIAAEEGLPLRKGPDDSYAQIDSFSIDTLLHVLGAMDESASWVYVYVPEDDVYGWMDSSFISQETEETDSEFDETKEEVTEEDETSEVTTKAEETTTAETTETTTAQQTTEASSENTSHKVNETESYTATVTALEGVYMRKGPGTSYDAITVLGQGEQVTVLGTDEESPNWIYIQSGENVGYVFGNYLEKNE